MVCIVYIRASRWNAARYVRMIKNLVAEPWILGSKSEYDARVSMYDGCVSGYDARVSGYDACVRIDDGCVG